MQAPPYVQFTHQYGRMFNVQFLQEAGWDSGPVWTRAENLAPTGILFSSQIYFGT